MSEKFTDDAKGLEDLIHEFIGPKYTENYIRGLKTTMIHMLDTYQARLRDHIKKQVANEIFDELEKCTFEYTETDEFDRKITTLTYMDWTKYNAAKNKFTMGES